MWSKSLLAVMIIALVPGCGGGKKKGTCDLAAPDCDEGAVCAPMPDGEGRCVSPVFIRGRVEDSATTDPIEGALVQVADINGAAVGSSDVTGPDGIFELQIPVPRNEDEAPAAATFTLRAQAAGYQPFPSGLRTALPLDASAAVEDGGGWVIDNQATVIRLLAFPGGAGLGSISGTVLAEPGAGVLVVAEGAAGGTIGYSSADGAYTIFNLPAGTYTVQGYMAGLNLEPVEVSLAAGEQREGVDLTGQEGPLATVSGRVQIVNAPGGAATSVVLAVESTFVENAARGEVPPGLRAPEPGLAPSIDSAWSIAGVPDGRYVVLAAFENDGLVRDPDPSISGTQLLHIEVAGQDIAIGDGFKITEALEVIWPGAAGLETITEPTPTFEWADDSGEDGFEVRVYDAFGEEIWADPNVPKFTGSGNPSLQYAGPALEAGMVYQFRATSVDPDGPLSQTEDLKGVFVYQPEE